MKIIIDRDVLIAALSPATGFNISKNTVSYADGVLFECPADENNTNVCRITAYDLDKGMITTCECTIVEEGKNIINTQKLLQIIRAMPQGQITITVDDKCRTVIESGTSRFEISAGKGEDFPMLPLLKGEKKYYLADQSFYYSTNTDNRINYGPSLENIVFLYAKSKDYKISVGRIGKLECDFILRDIELNYSYVQIAYTILASIDTENREYEPLENIKDNYPKYVMTTDYLFQKRNGIKHVNLIDFIKDNLNF